MELCTRAFDFEFEARSSSSGSGSGGKGDGRDLEGYAAVFNTSTRIRDLQGDFDETILPGAFSRSISRRMPVLQFDHGKDPAVGGAPIGKITHLAEDSKGLHVRARLFADASISRVREAIAEQAISGMSFRFGVPQGGDEWKRRNNDVDLREIRDTDIHELGPVVFPAYDATSVSVRSILSGLSAAEVRELVHELRESFGLAVDLRALDGGAADAYDEQDEEAPHAPRGNRHSPAADSFGASFPPDANGRATGGIIPPDSPSYWVGERGPETVIPRQRVAVHGAPRSTSDPQFLTGRSSARRADGGDTGTTPRSGVPVPTRTAAPATAVAPQSAEESRLFARALHAIGAL